MHLLLLLSLPLTSATLTHRSDTESTCLDLNLAPCGPSCIAPPYTCCPWGGGCPPGSHCDLPTTSETGEPGCCPDGMDCKNGGGSSTLTFEPPARPTPIQEEDEDDVIWVSPVQTTTTMAGDEVLPTGIWEDGEDEDEFGIFKPGPGEEFEWDWDDIQTRIDLDIVISTTTVAGIITASSTRVPPTTATSVGRVNLTTATSTTSIPRFSRPATFEDDDEDEKEEEVFTTTTRRIFSTASSDDAEPTVTGFRASTNAEEEVEESGAWNVEVERGISGVVLAGVIGIAGGWLL